jgi:hypothetical protein
MVAFIATAVAAQTTRQARVARSATQSDSEKQIMQIERNARQASLRNDITFFEQTMADDYFGIGPAGDIDNKERAITERKSGALHWESIAASEESVRVWGTLPSRPVFGKWQERWTGTTSAAPIATRVSILESRSQPSREVERHPHPDNASTHDPFP